MSITASTKLCMVIGDPVQHSLSPAMHNAGYAAAGLEGEFVYVGTHITSDDLAAFVAAIRVMNIRGVSCTMPHKQAIMPLLNTIDPIAQKIGAVNTVINNNGLLTGYNTDWLGIITPLETITTLTSKRVAVLGAGGSARAAIYGLINRGTQVTCYNRTLQKAEQIAAEFECIAQPLDAFTPTNFDCIINTIPGSDSPIDTSLLQPHHIVFDIIYANQTSALITGAKAVGCQTLTGHDMLLHQGMAQFELYTGKSAPEPAMRAALEEASL